MTDIHDSAGLYVVDALGEGERAEFEHHLRRCAPCQQEVAAMRETTLDLSRGLAGDPPSTLRASVLAQVAVTAQEIPSALEPRSTGSGAAADDNVRPLTPRRPSRFPQLLAAAAVVAALVLGGWAVQSQHSADVARGQVHQLETLLGAGDVRTTSGQASSGGTGTVVWSRSQTRAIFVGRGLAALPTGKVYELWTIAGKPAPAGTFSPAGTATVVALPVAALQANSVALTVEPAGGSPQPTSAPVLNVTLPAS